jgi:hypothetical protein
MDSRDIPLDLVGGSVVTMEGDLAEEQFITKDTTKNGRRKRGRKKGVRIGKENARCGDLSLPDKAEAAEDAERAPLSSLGGGS